MVSRECQADDLESHKQEEVEKGYLEQMQKLQKKMTELETYLTEKDKTILDQENQVTELQD